MRIGLVVYGDLDRRSGGFLYDRHLVDGLRDRGHTVSIFGQAEGAYLRQLRRGLSAESGIIDAAEELDIVLEDELNHPSLLGTNRAILRRRRQGLASPRIVAIVHHLRSSEPGFWLRRAMARYVERRFLRTLDAAVYNSRTTESTVLRLLEGESSRSHFPGVVAPPGTSPGTSPGAGTPALDDNPAAGRIPPPGDPRAPGLRLLFVGNVIPRKGVLPLIRAIGTLRTEERRQLSLTIAGGLEMDPPYRRRVERAIRRIESDCDVRLLGRVEDDELRRLYRSHDVLAVPSFYEGYGMVYAEAQRYGLAVLAGRGGAGPEVVEEGGTGLLVDPGKPASIRHALLRFLKEPNLAAQMGRAGGLAPCVAWEDTVSVVESFLMEQH